MQQFSRVYQAYGTMLYCIAMTHTGNPADAEDVLHDVFLRLLDKKPRFRDELHEKHWLIRVTINLCHNRSKAAKRSVPLPDTLPATENTGFVRDAILALPPKLKDVVFLHCYEGYSVEETAGILKIGVSAVKMRLVRAREKLKLELDG